MTGDGTFREVERPKPPTVIAAGPIVGVAVSRLSAVVRLWPRASATAVAGHSVAMTCATRIRRSLITNVSNAAVEGKAVVRSNSARNARLTDSW